MSFTCFTRKASKSMIFKLTSFYYVFTCFTRWFSNWHVSWKSTWISRSIFDFHETCQFENHRVKQVKLNSKPGCQFENHWFSNWHLFMMSLLALLDDFQIDIQVDPTMIIVRFQVPNNIATRRAIVESRWDSETCWCFIHVTVKLVAGSTRRSVIM